MATSGQTLNDRINAARYALAGQGLARCVCKATTEEVIGPKKKHLDYLLACTHEPNVSIPQLANLLIERTNHIYWVVVFKALVTVHHLMSYGNERFTQYLASSNYSFELSTFLDKTAARDFSMSTFIRRYSRYINEKALSYRLLAFDFCKVKRGNEGVLRIMPIDRLLKTLPILQNQLDALLEFDCSANDLNNGVINACFMLLFRDLIGLFACHNDGIINLLNKYFTLNRKMCREAFDLYKKFLIRMDKVSDFLRVAEVVGIDKDEIPDLRRAPSSLIEALEQHLQNIESNKKILKQQQSTNKSTGGDSFSALGNLTPPSSRRSNSPGNLASSASTLSGANNNSSQSDSEFSINSFKDDEVRKALEEEARVLSQYGTSDGGGKDSTKALKSAPREGSPKFAVTTIPKSVDDIFGDPDSFGNSTSNGTTLTDNNNCQTLDNLSSTSSSSSSATKHRPDIDSIKSAIMSATTTLENKNADVRLSSKKASDDLFSLLDTSASMQAVNPAIQSQQATAGLISGTGSSNLNDPISPFAASPFDMPLISNSNSHAVQSPMLAAALKKGNPFPEVGNDSFASNSKLAAFQSGFMPSTNQIQPMVSSQQPSLGNSVFNNSSSNTSNANYTNLGGLEGFGDLLQPIGSSSSANNRGSASNSSLGNSKSAFNAGSGLSNTGLFKGDLDSTLANLAQNLTFDGLKTKK